MIEDFNVNLSYSNMDNLIGEEVPRDQVKSILENLQIKIKEETNNGLSLLIPPFKVDVTREVDVIEEILRIYGYNAVKIPNKLKSSIVASKDSNKVKIANQISSLLSNNGFNEIMNNSLTKAEYFKLIEDIDESKNVEILNPLSNDLNVLRQSLLFGGLESIAHNQNRQNADLKFYEFGNTYHRENDNYVQNTCLQLLVTGRVYKENWNTKSDKVDFFYIKEKVEHILKRIGITHFKTEEISSNGYSQGLKYSFKKRRIVSFGKIENKLIKSFGIKSSVYTADFNWDTILDVINFNKIKCRFPSVRRDLSLLLDENIQFSQLEKLAFQVNKDILKSVNLFDVYEGDKLPKGKKSYALSFIMMDVNKTLTDKEVDVVMNKLIETYQITFGAQIR